MKKNVLIVVGSKHGSTYEIGEKISDTLKNIGFRTSLMKPDTARAVKIPDYDIIFLGSSVYSGRWRKDIIDYIEKNKSVLKSSVIHLFSSGPIGDPLLIDEHTDIDGRRLLNELGAVEHRIFAGKIDFKNLKLGQRMMLKALHAPEGDYRDWKEIEIWVKFTMKSYID